MGVLIGIAVVLGGGAVALYIWSSGGLFGRILVFLMLAPVLSTVIGAYFCPIDEAILHNPGGQIGFLAGLFLAWIAAGIPRYVRRADVFMARRAHSRREQHHRLQLRSTAMTRTGIALALTLALAGCGPVLTDAQEAAQACSGVHNPDIRDHCMSNWVAVKQAGIDAQWSAIGAGMLARPYRY